MHKSTIQQCSQTKSSYFRHQLYIDPQKNTKNLSPLVKISQKKIQATFSKDQRLKTQSVYQIQSSTEDKRSLKDRINQRISRESIDRSGTISKLQNASQKSKVSQTGEKPFQKQNQRLGCIRKMLFEDQSFEWQKSKNKENQCVNKMIVKKKERLKERSEFQERQKRQIESRLEKSTVMREEMRKNELKECTFKPKLTKYSGFI